MTITQTVEIPANRRLTIEVPDEVPTGRTILSFTPVQTANKPGMTEQEELELINRHADELNREAIDALSYQAPLWDDKQ